MLIRIFLSALIMVSTANAQEGKTYDARGMSIRERLELRKQIQEENKAQNQQSPQQKAESFFQDLKSKGKDALSSVKEGSMLNNETSKFVGQEMQKDMSSDEGITKINNALKEKDGIVEDYKKIGQDETLLNGMYYRTRYLIEYKNGKTQTVEMLYIKPTITGEYILTEINVD